jgi:ribosomal protein L40E
MSAQVCANCTAAYSVGAPACPQCGANNPRPDTDAPAGPSTTVRCPGQECPAYGVKRVVALRLAAPGVVERVALHCLHCDRALETVTDEEEREEQDMPKTTVHGGPSIEGAPETVVEMANGTLATAGEEQPEEESSPTPDAAGTTSSTSSPKEPSTPETSGSDSPRPARTTGSRSARGRTGSSSAPGTDGAPTGPTSKTDADES